MSSPDLQASVSPSKYRSFSKLWYIKYKHWLKLKSNQSTQWKHKNQILISEFFKQLLQHFWTEKKNKPFGHHLFLLVSRFTAFLPPLPHMVLMMAGSYENSRLTTRIPMCGAASPPEQVT
jgi:hypothetical protein